MCMAFQRLGRLFDRRGCSHAENMVYHHHIFHIDSFLGHQDRAGLETLGRIITKLI